MNGATTATVASDIRCRSLQDINKDIERDAALLSAAKKLAEDWTVKISPGCADVYQKFIDGGMEMVKDRSAQILMDNAVMKSWFDRVMNEREHAIIELQQVAADLSRSKADLDGNTADQRIRGRTYSERCSMSAPTDGVEQGRCPTGRGATAMAIEVEGSNTAQHAAKAVVNRVKRELDELQHQLKRAEQVTQALHRHQEVISECQHRLVDMGTMLRATRRRLAMNDRVCLNCTGLANNR
jgi:hypothetical protein